MLARDLFRNRSGPHPRDARPAPHRGPARPAARGRLKVARAMLVQVEELKAQRNIGSKEIGGLYREGRQADEAEEKKAGMADARRRNQGARGAAPRNSRMNPEISSSRSPISSTRAYRLAATRAPTGSNESGATRRNFDFEPNAHWDLGPALGIVDFERAAKVASSRFAVLRGAGAALETRPDQLHARPSHESRLHRGHSAVSGELGLSFRHRTAAEVRRRSLPCGGLRSLYDSRPPRSR